LVLQIACVTVRHEELICIKPMSVVPFLLGFDTTRSKHRDSRHMMPEAHLTGSRYSASSGSHLGQVRVSACADGATVKMLKTIPIAMMRPFIGLAFDHQQ